MEDFQRTIHYEPTVTSKPLPKELFESARKGRQRVLELRSHATIFEKPEDRCSRRCRRASQPTSQAIFDRFDRDTEHLDV